MSRGSNDIKDYGHVDLLYPGKYVKAGDLRGQDVTVVIEKIQPRCELKRQDGSIDYKPVFTLKGKDKTFICNVTNALSIGMHHGNDPRRWIGKVFTMYSTTVKAFGKIHDCIRVREPEVSGHDLHDPLGIDASIADEYEGSPQDDSPPPQDLEGGEL